MAAAAAVSHRWAERPGPAAEARPAVEEPESPAPAAVSRRWWAVPPAPVAAAAARRASAAPPSALARLLARLCGMIDEPSWPCGRFGVNVFPCEPNTHRKTVSQTVSQLFHGPAPRSPLPRVSIRLRRSRPAPPLPVKHKYRDPSTRWVAPAPRTRTLSLSRKSGVAPGSSHGKMCVNAA